MINKKQLFHKHREHVLSQNSWNHGDWIGKNISADWNEKWVAMDCILCALFVIVASGIDVTSSWEKILVGVSFLPCSSFLG